MTCLHLLVWQERTGGGGGGNSIPNLQEWVAMIIALRQLRALTRRAVPRNSVRLKG